MIGSNLIYSHNEQELYGYVAQEESSKEKRPVVLVVHDWTGRNDFACHKAQIIAEMGYIGFAIDVFGQGQLGANTEEKTALIMPFMKNRALLRERLIVALEAVKKLPEADTDRMAIIGFCFGGLCALDLARSGADIKGAVSFHGLLDKPEYSGTDEINAKILVLHGYDDPMVSPEQVSEFCQEMTKANADWQVQMYGKVQHAFTNPEAHDSAMGTVYNAIAEKRSWQAMTYFLQEIFKE